MTPTSVHGFHACGYSALTCRVRPSTCEITRLAARPRSASRPCCARSSSNPGNRRGRSGRARAAIGTTTRSPSVSRSSTCAGRAAQQLVDAAPEREHRDDGEHREDQPLGPVRQVDAGEAEQPDDRGRQANEYEVELRVDDEHLDAEQADSQHHPTPTKASGPPRAQARNYRPPCSLTDPKVTY